MQLGWREGGVEFAKVAVPDLSSRCLLYDPVTLPFLKGGQVKIFSYSS